MHYRYQLHHDTAAYTDQGFDQGRPAPANRANLSGDEQGLPGVHPGSSREPHGKPQTGLVFFF